MNPSRLVTGSALSVTLALSLGPAGAQASADASADAGTTPVGRIQWLMTEEPSRPDGAGEVRLSPTEKLLAYLARAWPAVAQTLVSANIKRSMQMLEGGEHACHASLVRTPERERLLYFANTVVLPPQQLVMRAADAARLPRNTAGEVDLAALLARPRLRGALIEGRSYGQTVDRMIARRPADSGLQLYSLRGYAGGRLLPMLSMERIDYTMEYPGVLAMLQARTPDMTALRGLPVQGSSELLRIGVACPRTPWGLAAAQGVDRVLGTPEGAAMLRASIEVLLTPDLGAAQRARLEAFFRARARPMPVSTAPAASPR
ncbi:MAG: TIGR02285 family protein [Burkholderiaceae bacterium]